MTLAEFNSLKAGDKVNFRGGRTYTIESVRGGEPTGAYRSVTCKPYRNIARRLDNARLIAGCMEDITDRSDYRNWRLA